MTSLSKRSADKQQPVLIASFRYRDPAATNLQNMNDAKQVDPRPPAERTPQPKGLPQAEVDDLVKRARAEAIAETEARILAEYELKIRAGVDNVRHAVDLFQAERKNYFSRVESEIVHLALAISAKILHREAQVEPMLVAALVRIAVEKLHDGSSVSVRVSPSQAERWRLNLGNLMNGSSITIVEDANLEEAGCSLETDLGSADFSIAAQLKEVEQGFFDLLAQRPSIK